MSENSQPVNRLFTKLFKLGIVCHDALDYMVHEIKAAEASAINNDGLHAQIELIFEEYSVVEGENMIWSALNIEKPEDSDGEIG